MRRTRGLVVVSAAALVAAAVPSLGASAAPATVSGYVVVLEPGSASPAAEAARLASRYGGQVGFVYSHALRGFSIRTTERAAAALAANPNVDYVEPDGVVSIGAQSLPTGVQRANAGANVGINGSDDQRVNVDVAVIDTGIDLDHQDLNVVDGVNCLTGSCVTGGDDDHYHGTHVAGTVAALDNDLGVVGVAPGARLWAVKVLNRRGSGSNSVVIAGVDWVAARASTIEVANMSLGGGYSQALNDAVAGAVADGVSMVVAAGNSAANAASYSPASEPSAITVSALADFNGLAGGGAVSTCRSDVDDTFANFSNYGTVIDMIAPGVCIESTYPGGSYATISGTSMASPHVAGGVALLRSTGMNRSDAESTLINAGNDGWTLGTGVVDDGEEEPLLDVRTFTPAMTPVGGGGTNTPPTASFTSSCTGLTCSFTDTSTDPGGSIASRVWDFGDGGTSTATNPSRTYATGGTYNVTLTVTDNGGASDSETRTVTVSSGGTAEPTFTPSSSRNGKSAWKATISVSQAAPGAVITGTWSPGGSGGCTAGSTGTCSFSLTKISNTIPSVTWTPTGGAPIPIGQP